MEAGELRHRVTIQHFVTGSPQQTSSGAPDGAWATYLTVYGKVVALSGRALFVAQQHDSEVTHRIDIRYRSGVTDQMRVLFSGLYFYISWIDSVEFRNAELYLYCKQGIVDG